MYRFHWMRKYALRFLAVLSLVGMIVYTVYHVMDASAESVLTTPVQQITDVRVLTSNAYLFREETVLTASSEGLIQSVATSGSKVAKGAPLAEVYAYNETLLDEGQTELDLLNRYIAVLESGTSTAGNTLSDAQAWKAEAEACYLEILQAAHRGKFQNVGELEDQMLTLLTRYQALTEGKTDSSVLLQTLKQQRDALLRELLQTVSNTQSSGYFYDRTMVDGYEELFSPAGLESLMVADLDALIATDPKAASDATVVGKMAYGYEWYLAIRLDGSAPELFEEGVRYRVVFSENDSKELILTCERVLYETEAGGGAVILSCREYPTDFTFYRVQKVKLSIETLTGYYIPDSALQHWNGTDGVYIFENMTVRFRKIEILYSGDGYCIAAEQGDLGSEYLKLNDLLITYGKKLYDGKVYG